MTSLRWENLGEEYIVFNPLSDEVHRLNPVAAATLSELETAAMNLTTLGQRIATLMEIELDRDLLSQLYKILRDFDEIGLVSTSSPLNPAATKSIYNPPPLSG